MAELEVTKETYEQLLEKLKHWRQEQRRLELQVKHEIDPAREKPSRELIQAKAQLEEVTSRITQLEAKLQSVRIIATRNTER
ncbi:MAG: hypothetical protein A2Z92_04860 [Omnitrophica WOR_2 bacterium GWA2_63_20]|nr:MAG: hypothetical protein A2Z92_04860 [Omnitrophica WOR_2 bacterium GWA2_63_20]OGX17499.1 MAG: hypothetical protein A2105_01370 [Omnitrophica WOR_2 bacterium GWF2_63_9]HAM40479.1 hypothetical protein [Candidatus Omnitrophota bacterium]HBQ38947.1 hypothetical protein [Candidatus Omnitrophota bacterium]